MHLTRTRQFLPLFQYLKSIGFNYSPFIQKLGFPSEVLYDHNLYCDEYSMWKLAEIVAAKTGNRNWAFEAATRLNMGLLISNWKDQFLSAATVKDAICLLINRYKVEALDTKIALQDCGQDHWLTLTNPRKNDSLGRAIIELFDFKLLMRFTQLGLGENWLPAESKLKQKNHYQIIDNKHLAKHSVKYGSSVTGFAIPSDMLLKPMPNFGDSTRSNTTEASNFVPTDLDDISLSDRIGLLLVGYLENAPSIDACAAAFNVSRRTIQRQLKANGTTYKELLESVRMKVALSKLSQTDISITELSNLLGYEHSANFSRAFSRYYQTSPSNIRQLGTK